MSLGLSCRFLKGFPCLVTEMLFKHRGQQTSVQTVNIINLVGQEVKSWILPMYLHNKREKQIPTFVLTDEISKYIIYIF